MHFVILFFLFLASCSDALTYSKGTEPISVDLLTPSDTVFIGDSVKFRVNIKPSTEYAKTFYWNLNSTKYYRRPIDTAFTEIGIYNATFYLVDYLDDTLRTNTVTITVIDKPKNNTEDE